MIGSSIEVLSRRIDAYSEDEQIDFGQLIPVSNLLRVYFTQLPRKPAPEPLVFDLSDPTEPLYVPRRPGLFLKFSQDTGFNFGPSYLDFLDILEVQMLLRATGHSPSLIIDTALRHGLPDLIREKLEGIRRLPNKYTSDDNLSSAINNSLAEQADQMFEAAHFHGFAGNPHIVEDLRLSIDKISERVPLRSFDRIIVRDNGNSKRIRLVPILTH